MGFDYEEWKKEFAPKLYNTRRWHGFSFVAKELAEKKEPKILEVGCVRVEGSWEADGQSTRVWDWIMGKTQGFCYSVDIEPEHARLAQKLCPNVSLICQDGIELIVNDYYQFMKDIDVLFLDGMDFTGPHAYNAWMQHIGLLAAAWPKLKPGCLIVLDDCVDNNEGKHVLIKDFFRRMGNDPLVESYMHIWRMR